jgi:hypothetical protein
MALSVSGQWLVNAGMRMMSRDDQAAWFKWAADAGWSPTSREPKQLPPSIAAIALGALDRLMGAIDSDLREGRLTERQELDAANDLDHAKAVTTALQKDQQYRSP